MCGIAGIIDLAEQRTVPDEMVRRMARAIVHRGPDEEGFFFQPGVALASRRLSIVGLADGQQPVTNEEANVVVVFNGELFDHLERRAELEARGHRLVKHCDTEVIPHLWEEYQQGMFERLILLPKMRDRSEEHTSELQSLRHLVCRLLLEKKKTHTTL